MTSKADRLNSEGGGQSLLGIRWLLAGVGAVLISAAVSVASGPVSIPLGQVVRELLDHLPLLEVEEGDAPAEDAPAEAESDDPSSLPDFLSGDAA